MQLTQNETLLNFQKCTRKPSFQVTHCIGGPHCWSKVKHLLHGFNSNIFEVDAMMAWHKLDA